MHRMVCIYLCAREYLEREKSSKKKAIKATLQDTSTDNDDDDEGEK